MKAKVVEIDLGSGGIRDWLYKGTLQNALRAPAVTGRPRLALTDHRAKGRPDTGRKQEGHSRYRVIGRWQGVIGQRESGAAGTPMVPVA